MDTALDGPMLVRSGSDDVQASSPNSLPSLVRSSRTDPVIPDQLGDTSTGRVPFSAIIPSMMRLEAPSQPIADIAGASAVSRQLSPMIDAQDANKQSKDAGGPDNLFDAPVSQAQAQFLIKRNVQMAQDRALVDAYDQQYSWYDPSFLATHAVPMLADPLGLATTLATGGTAGLIEKGSAAIAAKLGDNFAARSAGRAVTGAALGAGMQAPISAGHLEQTNLGIGDYALKDALNDIALQAGLGAGLDVGLGAVFGKGAARPAERPVPGLEGEATPSMASLDISTLSDAHVPSPEASMDRVSTNVSAIAEEKPFLSPKSVNDLQVANDAVNKMNVFLQHQDAIRQDSDALDLAQAQQETMAQRLADATATPREAFDQIEHELATEQTRLSQHLAAVQHAPEMADVAAEMGERRAQHATWSSAHDVADEDARHAATWQEFVSQPEVKKPAAPQLGLDLLAYMRSQGGLWAPEHDLANTHNLAPGLDLRKEGLSVDAMGERLAEARFFGAEGLTEYTRPTETEVLDKIAEAKTAKLGKVYSHDDMQKLVDHDAALRSFEDYQRHAALKTDIDATAAQTVGGLTDSEKGHIVSLVSQGHAFDDAVGEAVERTMMRTRDSLVNEVKHVKRSRSADAAPRGAGSKRGTAKPGKRPVSTTDQSIGESIFEPGVPATRLPERGEAPIGKSLEEIAAGRDALANRIAELETRHRELQAHISGALYTLEAARTASVVKGLKADLARRQREINKTEREIAKAEGRSMKAQSGLDVPHAVAMARTQARQAALEEHTAHSIRRFAGGMGRTISREDALTLARDLLSKQATPEGVIEVLKLQRQSFRGAMAEMASARIEATAAIQRIREEFLAEMQPLRQEAASVLMSDIKGALPPEKVDIPPPRPAPPKAKGEPTLVVGENIPEPPALVQATKAMRETEALLGVPPEVKSVEGAPAAPRFSDPELAATEAELKRAESLVDAAKEAAACLMRSGA